MMEFVDRLARGYWRDMRMTGTPPTITPATLAARCYQDAPLPETAALLALAEHSIERLHSALLAAGATRIDNGTDESATEYAGPEAAIPPLADSLIDQLTAVIGWREWLTGKADDHGLRLAGQTMGATEKVDLIETGLIFAMLHTSWERHGKPHGDKHPLGPLVRQYLAERYWEDQPLTTVHRGPRRMLPRLGTGRKAALPTVIFPHNAPDVHLQLPLLPEHQSRPARRYQPQGIEPSPWLMLKEMAFLFAGHGQHNEYRAWRSLRLLIELLTTSQVRQRRGDQVIEASQTDLRAWLYANGPGKNKGREDRELFLALHDVDGLVLLDTGPGLSWEWLVRRVNAGAGPDGLFRWVVRPLARGGSGVMYDVAAFRHYGHSAPYKLATYLGALWSTRFDTVAFDDLVRSIYWPQKLRDDTQELRKKRLAVRKALAVMESDGALPGLAWYDRQTLVRVTHPRALPAPSGR